MDHCRSLPERKALVTTHEQCSTVPDIGIHNYFWLAQDGDDLIDEVSNDTVMKKGGERIAGKRVENELDIQNCIRIETQSPDSTNTGSKRFTRR